MSKNKPAILLVANWDSNVGYAWWLMESYWEQISITLRKKYQTILVYPRLSTVPDNIRNNIDLIEEINFRDFKLTGLIQQLRYISKNNIKSIYFTDHKTWHWIYFFYKACGVQHIIIHDHTPGLRTKPGRLKYWLKRTLNTTAWISADHVFSVSEFVYQRHLMVYAVPKEKCHIINNGIRLIADIQPVDLRSRFKIPAERKVLVSVSRANKYKRVDFIVQCMNQLVHVRGLKNLHFLFCGDGPDLNEFKKLVVNLKLTQYVSMPGKCDDVIGILAGCDIAIHPSQGEVGYSLSILEYMMCGLPVIVPDNPSVCAATVDNETGCYYPEEDVFTAADKIERLVHDNELRNRLSRQAINHVNKYYRLEHAHYQLNTVLKTIFESSKIKKRC